MIRKISFALATVGAISAVALAPTSASAFGGKGGGGGWGHHYGHGFGFGLGLAAGVVATDACLRRTIVETPFGPTVRWINVCF